MLPGFMEDAKWISKTTVLINFVKKKKKAMTQWIPTPSKNGYESVDLSSQSGFSDQHS